MFSYRTLTAEDAVDWFVLRLEGARAAPSGFLVTEDEVSQMDKDRARQVLDFGGLRGVFEGETLYLLRVV